MELSLHINTDNPADIAAARAVLDFVERGIADAPREPFVPVPATAADAPAPVVKRPRPSRKTRNAVKDAVNGRGTATDSGELQREIVLTDTQRAEIKAAAAELTTPDAAARAVHAKNGKVGDVLDLLAPFKVTRVSELSKEQGAEFVIAAKAFVGVA
jgi:hypothetical protein